MADILGPPIEGVTTPPDPGCYICQPHNPDAAEEGCRRCERDYWRWVFGGRS